MNDNTTISLLQLFQLYPDQESAREYLEQRRWPDGVCCPQCASKERITARDNGYYRCNSCKLDFTIRTGTVFERSHIPLHKWLYAMYLLVTARKGISSLQLSKEISVTQKSAWFMLQRLREACGSDIDKLGGIVEVDETYVGGKERNKQEISICARDEMVITHYQQQHRRLAMTDRACKTPVRDLLAEIPHDLVIKWQDKSGLKAWHNCPIGRLAQEAIAALEAKPEPDQLDIAIERGTKAWAELPDDWPENLRGGPAKPMAERERELNKLASFWSHASGWEDKQKDAAWYIPLLVVADYVAALTAKHESQLAAKDAEIAALKAGMVGDYDLDAWLDWRLDRFNAKLAQAKAEGRREASQEYADSFTGW